MNGSTLQHVLRRALRSLWENLYLNSVATAVIAMAVLLLGVFLTVQHNLERLVDSWDRDVHVSAYFHTDVPEARRLDLRDRVAADPAVASVRYVSEAEAREWLVARVEDLDDVLAELGPGTLPASLEIGLVPEMASPTRIGEFARGLEGSEFAQNDFSDVDFGREWVERFNAFLSLLELLGLILGALILVAAVFLVVNTVNLVVYNRRNELEVQKLVGATTSFIVLPFLFEGLVQGLVGSLLALVGLTVVQELVVSRLQEALQLDIAGELAHLPPSALAALVLSGTLLGITAAGFSVSRFLRKTP